MAVYRYTMVKYLKSVNTWVLFVLVVGISFAINGPLVFSRINFTNNSLYSTVAHAIYTGNVLLFVLFAAIFNGFKGARCFRDEVDNGTFLIVLSKPQSRSKIIFFKWLALATMNLIYILLMLGTLVLAIYIYDKPVGVPPIYANSMRAHLPAMFGILFALGFLVFFIFASVSLILSTRLSGGATIGITIGIGILVQITSLLSQFAATTTHDTSFINSENYFLILGERNIEKIKNQKNVPLATINKEVEEYSILLPQIYTVIMGQNTKVKIPYAKDQPQTINSLGLGFLGLKETNISTFHYLSWIDLSYQVGLLGSVANDYVNLDNNTQNLPPVIKGGPSSIKKQVVLQKYNSGTGKTLENNVQGFIDKSNNIVKTLFPQRLPAQFQSFDFSWFINVEALTQAAKNLNITLPKPTTQKSDTNLIKFYMFDQPNSLSTTGKLDEITYKDFLNKNDVLIFYATLTVVLLPVSYLVVRRKDFR